jgi:hypothetical protein
MNRRNLPYLPNVDNGGLIPFIYRPSADEMRLWKQAAAARDTSARSKGLRDRHGASSDPLKGLGLHFLGVAGEAGFARFQHLDDWAPTVDTFRSMPDVGEFEVRCRSRHTYDLLVRADDSDESRYILATCENGVDVWVWGWIEGRDARQERFLAAHGGREPAYFVPKGELQPLDLLPWEGVKL